MHTQNLKLTLTNLLLILSDGAISYITFTLEDLIWPVTTAIAPGREARCDLVGMIHTLHVSQSFPECSRIMNKTNVLRSTSYC